MFLILTPENKEVFTKLLRHLDKKGWTFGKSIKDYRGTIIDLYIFLYENKTIRIGAASSLDYVSKTVPIITVNDAPRDDLLFEYDKWIEGFKKELEKSILKGVYEYGKPSL